MPQNRSAPVTAASRCSRPPPFACTWERGGSNAAWVYVAGELDIATSPQLRLALGEAGSEARLVVLDLREVTFIDSAGIHAILDAAADARRRWGRLMLVRGSVPVERMLTLTQLADHVPIFDLDLDPPQRGLPDAS